MIRRSAETDDMVRDIWSAFTLCQDSSSVASDRSDQSDKVRGKPGESLAKKRVPAILFSGKRQKNEDDPK